MAGCASFFQVVVVVPDVIDHAAFAFEREDRGANAIQKIAIMAYHDDAAAEGDERFLEQAQRAEIEIVRRFVEHQNVAASLQDFSKQHPAAFAAAELRNLRVDALFAEKKSPQISAQGDALLTERDVFSTAPDFFPNRFLIVEEEPILIDVIDLGSRADLHCTARGGQFLQNDFEERRLAESVATDNTEALPGCEVEIHVLKECAATQLHTHVAQFNNAIRELRRRGDNQLDVELRLRRFLGGHLEITFHAVDRFRPAGARRFSYPLQFPFQKLLSLMFLRLLDRLSLRAREQVIGVVAVVADELAARQLDDPRCHSIKKIAIVRNEQTGAGITREKVFQPFDRAGVQMVGRFVENQKIGTREKRPAKRDTAFFSAGKRAHDAIGFRSVQIRDERLDSMFQVPTVGLANLVEERGAKRAVARDTFIFVDEIENPLRAAENVRVDRGRIVQAGKLWHVAGDEITPACEFTRIGLGHTRRDLEEGRFARAVAADKPNVFALLEGNRRAVEDDLMAVLDGKVVRARDDCG